MVYLNQCFAISYKCFRTAVDEGNFWGDGKMMKIESLKGGKIRDVGNVRITSSLTLKKQYQRQNRLNIINIANKNKACELYIIVIKELRWMFLSQHTYDCAVIGRCFDGCGLRDFHKRYLPSNRSLIEELSLRHQESFYCWSYPGIGDKFKLVSSSINRQLYLGAVVPR